MPPTAEERRERAENPPVYVRKPKPWEIESEPQQASSPPAEKESIFDKVPGGWSWKYDVATFLGIDYAFRKLGGSRALRLPIKAYDVVGRNVVYAVDDAMRATGRTIAWPFKAPFRATSRILPGGKRRKQTRLLKARQKKAGRMATRAQERGASTLARVDALKAKGYKFRTATADEVRFMKTQFPDWKKKLTWKGDRILVKGKRIATKTGSSIKSLGKSAGSKALSGGKYVIKKAPSAIGRRAKMIKRF